MAWGLVKSGSPGGDRFVFFVSGTKKEPIKIEPVERGLPIGLLLFQLVT